MMNKECKLITPENIQGELINNEIEQINLRVQAFKEQKYNELLKENQELKKQLEELDKKLFFTKNELDMRQKSIDNKLNQQKEFIEYLENEIKNQKSEIFSNSLTSEDINLYIMRIKLLKCEEILSKYKEIIGGKDDNK